MVTEHSRYKQEIERTECATLSTPWKPPQTSNTTPRHMPTKNVTVIVGTTYVPASTSIENVVGASTTSQYTDTTTPLDTQTATDVRNTTSVLAAESKTSLISSIIPVESTLPVQHNHSTDNVVAGLPSSTFVYTTSSLSSVNTPVLSFPPTTLVTSSPQLATLPPSSSSTTSIPVTQSIVLVTKTISTAASPVSTSSPASIEPSVITQTLTITPSTTALPFSVSSGSTRDYLIYTQNYVFTDDSTSFSTGLLHTTTLKKSASGIILPTGVQTKPASYYKAYMDGSLDGSLSSSGSSNSATQHHKNVIIGSVVGTVLGVAACVGLGVLYYMFVRRRRQQSQQQYQPKQSLRGDKPGPSGEKSTGDPFDSEFQFHERVPGQIPVLPLGSDAEISHDGDDSSLQDSYDMHYDVSSSVNSADYAYQSYPYANSDDYSYTRSIRDWGATE